MKRTAPPCANATNTLIVKVHSFGATQGQDSGIHGIKIQWTSTALITAMTSTIGLRFGQMLTTVNRRISQSGNTPNSMIPQATDTRSAPPGGNVCDGKVKLRYTAKMLKTSPRIITSRA